MDLETPRGKRRVRPAYLMQSTVAISLLVAWLLDRCTYYVLDFHVANLGWGFLTAHVIGVWMITSVMLGTPLVRFGWLRWILRYVWREMNAPLRPPPREPTFDTTWQEIHTGCLVMMVAVPAMILLVVAWNVLRWLLGFAHEWPLVFVTLWTVVNLALFTLALWMRGMVGRTGANARARYDARVAALERAGLEEGELHAAKERAKQQFLKELEAEVLT